MKISIPKFLGNHRPLHPAYPCRARSLLTRINISCARSGRSSSHSPRNVSSSAYDCCAVAITAAATKLPSITTKKRRPTTRLQIFTD
ncbi:MAG TPA: hypothetical protein VG101_10780 [Puia sp.]|jgi:hypothetical protein|nr:hypothetical protein [Puia sp.]